MTPSTVPVITRRKQAALGRVFAREIEGTLPLQSKAAIYKELESDGLVEPYSRDLGHDRFGSLIVSGWALTQLGRLIYCTNCDLGELAWP